MHTQPEPATPGPGQESVWDYPRPPRIERVDRRIRVIFAGQTIAETTRAIKYMETSHPPGYYIPAEDVRMNLLSPTSHRSMCEYKGTARYYDIVVNGDVSRDAAWQYPSPWSPYEDLAGHISFYPQKVDEASVDGEAVDSQQGSFYGGWITGDVTGPFKGAPGTLGW